MHDDVGAEEEGGGVEGGEERVVYQDKWVGRVGMGDVGHERDVDQPQGRVGGGFYPN